MAARYEGVQIKALRNCTLVYQEFDLFEVYYVCELEDKLLWVRAETCAFPTTIRGRNWIEKISSWTLMILT